MDMLTEGLLNLKGVNTRSLWVSVRNLERTTRDKVPGGWKNWWEEKTKRNFEKCSTSGCGKKAIEGSHVQKVEEDKVCYIVPLCHDCNEKPPEVIFEVVRDNLVPR